MLRELAKNLKLGFLVSFFEDINYWFIFGKLYIGTVGYDNLFVEVPGRKFRFAGKENVIKSLASKHERKNVGVFVNLLPSYSSYYDIGANIGIYSVLSHYLLKSGSRKVCFEPNKSAFEKLQINLFGFGFKIFNCGLSDTNTEVYVTELQSSVTTTIDPSLRQGEKIQVKKSSEIFENDASNSFIKIDVEGHEIEVLSGMLEVLKCSQNLCVYVEVHFTLLKKYNKKGDFNKIIRVLKKNNFRCFWVDRSHLLLLKR